MTREEAITILNMVEAHGSLVVQAKDMAIKALSAEPCEDAVSRQAVLYYIDNMPSELTADGRRMIRRRTLEEYISDTLPSVKPQYTEAEIQKIQELEQAQLEKAYEIGKAEQTETGRWSRKTKVDAYDIAGVKTWGIKCQCDKCDFTTTVVEDFGYYKYCPNCGCRMVESEGEE